MRKVQLAPSRMNEEQRINPLELLPPAIRNWRVNLPRGKLVPLWDRLKAHARRLAPNEPLPEFRIACIDRVGVRAASHDQGIPREAASVAFAAMQLLATHGDPNLLYVCSPRPELRDRVLGVVGLDGAYVSPDFTRTEQTLRLPPGTVTMENGLPADRARLQAFTSAGDAAAEVLAELIEAGRISVGHLVAVAAPHLTTSQLETMGGLIAQRDQRGLARLLSRGPAFRRVRRLVQTAPSRPLAELAGESPFSSTLIPAAWAASAWAILEIAETKLQDSWAPEPKIALRPSRITLPLVKILRIMVSNYDETGLGLFALQLCRQTKLSIGTVQPALRRMETWGWVATTWEGMEEARAAGRPRRRYYRLSRDGHSMASAVLSESLPEIPKSAVVDGGQRRESRQRSRSPRPPKPWSTPEKWTPSDQGVASTREVHPGLH
jgi:DNA-binding PadR family transcriptional regulator